MVHCGIYVQCIVGFVRLVYSCGTRRKSSQTLCNSGNGYWNSISGNPDSCWILISNDLMRIHVHATSPYFHRYLFVYALFNLCRGNWTELAGRAILHYYNGGRQSTGFSRWLWKMAEICKLLPDWFMLHSRVNQYGDRIHHGDPGFLVAVWWRESDGTTDWKPHQRVSWCCLIKSKLYLFRALELQGRVCVDNCRYRGRLVTTLTMNCSEWHYCSKANAYIWFHVIQ